MKDANLKMLHTECETVALWNILETFWKTQKYKSAKIVSDAEGYERGRDEPVNRVDFQGTHKTPHI